MDSRDLQGLMEAYTKICAPVDEAVYGGEPEKPKDTRMVVTAADKKGNTPAYQKFKAGHKGYKAADHLGEESVDEAVKGASPHTMEMRRGAAAERRRGIKPKSAKEGERYADYKMAQMAHSERERMGEELDIFDAILEYLVAEGYAATNKEALVIMANMSEEWRESILDEEQLDEISDRKVRGMLRKREAQDVDSGGISAAYMANRRAQQAAARRNVRTGSNVKVDPILSKEEYVDEAKYARENPEKYEGEQAKKTSKKEKAMNDPHKGIKSPAFAEFVRKQMGR